MLDIGSQNCMLLCPYVYQIKDWQVRRIYHLYYFYDKNNDIALNYLMFNKI